MEAQAVELEVKNAKGKKVGTRSVPAEIFARAIPEGLFHQIVRWQRAKKRAGTHQVLTRSKVRGGGSKPWRQKGTGRARAGSSSSPLWVGGGVAHGPKPRSYEFRVNKKEKRQAICGALSARREEGNLFLLEELGLSGIKTKDAAGVLSNLGFSKGDKLLMVCPEDDSVSPPSLRNIRGVQVTTPRGLNVYQVLDSKFVYILDPALDAIQNRLAG